MPTEFERGMQNLSRPARQWLAAHPDGPERRRVNRVADLLTPISHVADDTYNGGVMAAIEALTAGRIHTGYDDLGNPTYLVFTDD